MTVDKHRLEKILRRQIGVEKERFQKKLAKESAKPPIKNPRERDLEFIIEPSAEHSGYFTDSAIIGGKLYLVNWGGWGSIREKYIAEFGLLELLPVSSANGHKIVRRIGTTEHYALGKASVWRKGKLHNKSLIL
jgi:hypothetical protein